MGAQPAVESLPAFRARTSSNLSLSLSLSQLLCLEKSSTLNSEPIHPARGLLTKKEEGKKRPDQESPTASSERQCVCKYHQTSVVSQTLSRRALREREEGSFPPPVSGWVATINMELDSPPQTPTPQPRPRPRPGRGQRPVPTIMLTSPNGTIRPAAGEPPPPLPPPAVTAAQQLLQRALGDIAQGEHLLNASLHDTFTTRALWTLLVEAEHYLVVAHGGGGGGNKRSPNGSKGRGKGSSSSSSGSSSSSSGSVDKNNNNNNNKPGLLLPPGWVPQMLALINKAETQVLHARRTAQQGRGHGQEQGQVVLAVEASRKDLLTFSPFPSPSSPPHPSHPPYPYPFLLPLTPPATDKRLRWYHRPPPPPPPSPSSSSSSPAAAAAAAPSTGLSVVGMDTCPHQLQRSLSDDSDIHQLRLARRQQDGEGEGEETPDWAPYFRALAELQIDIQALLSVIQAERIRISSSSSSFTTATTTAMNCYPTKKTTSETAFLAVLTEEADILTTTQAHISALYHLPTTNNATTTTCTYSPATITTAAAAAATTSPTNRMSRGATSPRTKPAEHHGAYRSSWDEIRQEHRLAALPLQLQAIFNMQCQEREFLSCRPSTAFASASASAFASAGTGVGVGAAAAGATTPTPTTMTMTMAMEEERAMRRIVTENQNRTEVLRRIQGILREKRDVRLGMCLLLRGNS